MISSPRFRTIVAAIFIVFITLPILGLVILGSAKPYGQRPFRSLDFVVSKPSVLFKHDAKYRSELISGILERTPVRPVAVRANNAFNYEIVGFVNTSRIVSGEGNWLFYKPQFWNGNCRPSAWFTRALQFADTLQALATAADLNIRFSVSPDKISIYPEKLGVLSEGYVGCRHQSGELWRRLSPKFAPHLIDHTVALRAEKVQRQTRGDDRLLYFRTDTHWNPSIANTVATDLIAALRILGSDQRKIQLSLGAQSRRTDLRNNMLLLKQREDVPFREVAFPVVSKPHAGPIIIHDSFYGVIKSALATAFPDARFFHIERDRAKYTSLIKHAKSDVIINSVERVFFARFSNSLRAPAALAVVKRNMIAARKRCRFVAGGNETPKIEPQNAVLKGNIYHARNRDPILIATRRSVSENCLRVVLDLSTAGLFEVFLPPIAGRAHAAEFQAGRSFALSLKPGRHDLRFILPARLETPRIRIDPTNHKSKFRLIKLQFGIG